MLEFLKGKKKEKLDCLGYYDIKPYHYFESNMKYQNNPLIIQNEFVRVYIRLYRKALIIMTFVDNEKGFSKDKYSYEVLKDRIAEYIEEEPRELINLFIFKNKNDNTINIAKEQVKNTKNYFSHTFVYDEKRVRINYYRPVPSFYSLYKYYQDALISDLGVIDLE